MKKSNSSVSLLNDLQSGHMTWLSSHIMCTSSCWSMLIFQFVMWFSSKEDIFSKLAPALISTVFQLQSSAIHHRKGFCEAVWKKSWKPYVVYWKFPEKQRASFLHALQKTIRKREGGFAAFSYFSRPKFNSWTSDEASPVIGEFCGDDLPARFISPSNEILLVFKSDGSSNYKGFQMEYKTSSKSFSNFQLTKDLESSIDMEFLQVWSNIAIKVRFL